MEKNKQVNSQHCHQRRESLEEPVQASKKFTSLSFFLARKLFSFQKRDWKIFQLEFQYNFLNIN